MDNILRKKIQSRLSNYILSTNNLTKPQTRCLKEMIVGILKSKSVLVNQIASSLLESLKLKDVCKRLSAQYLKPHFSDEIIMSHLKTVSCEITEDTFLVANGTDIAKKYSKFMEGLEFVRDGDKSKTALGFNVLNVNAVNSDKEITPLVSKAYSFEMGAYSCNQELKKIAKVINEQMSNKGCWVFDRGADNGILKDFFIEECEQCIIRLKRNSKVDHKSESIQVKKLLKKIEFSIKQEVIKVNKNRRVPRIYEIGALKISRKIKGKTHDLWLVVSRNTYHGGLCYLLVKSKLKSAIKVAKWAFNGYGLRWSIEEYHRHVKQEYKLEDIQIKTFNGLQSMLAILTVAMYVIYKKINSLHVKLLLESSLNLLNENKIHELYNFVYYKISKIVAFLLSPTKIRWKTEGNLNDFNPKQLKLMFD